MSSAEGEVRSKHAIGGPPQGDGRKPARTIRCMPAHTIIVSEQDRQSHLRWLREVTQIPTASGKEDRVIAWIEEWLRGRAGVTLSRDNAGNLHVAREREPGGRPIYFTAHLDHPAFVVERIIAPEVVELSFRGGVMDDYFENSPVVVHDGSGAGCHGTIFGPSKPGEPDGKGKASPFKHYMAELRHPTDTIRIGDVATWDIGPSEILEGQLHAPACDDLAALAAALAAYDVLLREEATQPVRLLFTRAEEIGFVGAIGACRAGTMAKEARVIALENSRSFAESPIGGGPIVRVGDRLSIFTPGLTDAIAKRAEEISGGAASVTASQKVSERPAWKWQRKLMAGGACEASVFCAAGFEATCVCLPLGNYHNMADLEAVQAGTNSLPARIAREYIAVSDFEGLVDLLIACGRSLPAGQGVGDRFERLWAERSFVLG